MPDEKVISAFRSALAGSKLFLEVGKLVTAISMGEFTEPKEIVLISPAVAASAIGKEEINIKVDMISARFIHNHFNPESAIPRTKCFCVRK